MSLAANETNLFALRAGTGDGVSPDVVAAAFTAELSYATGNLVMHEGTMYRAREDIAAGEWDVSKWAEVSVSDVVPEITHTSDAGTRYSKNVDAVESDVSVSVKFSKGSESSTDDVELIAMNAKDVTVENAGKVLAINADGTGVELTENGETGLLTVAHDNTLDGEGNEESPLSAKEMVGVVAIPTSVHIGENDYKIVKVGDKYWLAENFKEPLGTGDDNCTPAENGIDTDGMLYAWHALYNADTTLRDELGDMLPEGWHVPSETEYNDLYLCTGTTHTELDEDSGMMRYYGSTPVNIGSRDGWDDSFRGIDKYGLAVRGSGLAVKVDGMVYYEGANVGVGFHTSSIYEEGGSKYFVLTEMVCDVDEEPEPILGIAPMPINYPYAIMMSLRLCCDAEIVERVAHDGEKGIVPKPEIDDANKFLSSSGTWEKPNFPVFTGISKSSLKVKVGEREYPVVKIGNLYWMAENLGECIGTEGSDYVWYDDDKLLVDSNKFGALYKFNTVCDGNGGMSDALKALVPNGWRMPSSSDLGALKGVVKNGEALTSKYFGGTDKYNFDGVLAGYGKNDSDGTVETSGYGDGAILMSATVSTSNDYDGGDNASLSTLANDSDDVVHYSVLMWSTDIITIYPTSSLVPSDSAVLASVRLCCDADLIESGADCGVIGVISKGEEGLVPEPVAGDEEKFLCGNGNWETVPEMTGASKSQLFIDIENSRYAVVKIGGYYWLAGNLGIAIGDTGAWAFYDNDQSSALARNYGVLYRWDAVCSANGEMTDTLKSMLPDGWHIPSLNEMHLLFDAVSTESLSDTHGVNTIGGTNDYGFFAVPSGRAYYDSTEGKICFVGGGSETTYLTSTVVPGYGTVPEKYSNVSWSWPNGSTWDYYTRKKYSEAALNDMYGSLRLCCSADVVENGTGGGVRGTFGQNSTPGLVPTATPDKVNCVLTGSGTWETVESLSKSLNIDNGSGSGSLVLNSISSNTASGQYSVAEGSGNTATAICAHAEGSGNNATASFAHAEGGGTNATGTHAHAEGAATTASANAAHSEGSGTTASGESSHAEGFGMTEASGIGSHAEGCGTKAIGEGAHSEGGGTSSTVGTTTATGKFSHAEGNGTKAEKDYSHSEGDTTTASGIAAHAEGANTTATSNYAHAEGTGTHATGSGSHSEGSGTTASGTSSHAEGFMATASGSYSHVEGSRSTASGDYSHAEGNYTSAYGDSSHSEGGGTKAYSNCSHVEGSGTTVTTQGFAAHAEGGNTTADAMYAHVEGCQSTASGNYSHAEGYSTLASQQGAHAEGYSTQATYERAHAEGWSTLASNEASHAEGYQSKASGYYSHAEGQSTVASADAAHAEGIECEASSTYAHAEGHETKATNSAAHSEGNLTEASGSYSHAEGSSSVASGNSSHAEGLHSKSAGSYSHAEGNYSEANGETSHVEGEHTIANGSCQHVFGKYNVADTASVEIVGWGTADDTRKNIRRMDNSGNMYLAGNIYVNGDEETPISGGSVEFYTAEEVNEILDNLGDDTDGN